MKNTSLLHVVKISGLKPGTGYRYRVYAQEVLDHQGVEVTYGKVAATDVYGVKPFVFTTNDRHKPETSFAMINDIHGRTDDIPKLLEVADYKKMDMIIFNGDMLTQLKDESGLFSGFMDVAIDLFAKEKPMYYARGNHETRGLFATSFQRYFSPKEPHLYYLVRQGPVCFIFWIQAKINRIPTLNIVALRIMTVIARNRRNGWHRQCSRMISSRQSTRLSLRTCLLYPIKTCGMGKWKCLKSLFLY